MWHEWMEAISTAVGAAATVILAGLTGWTLYVLRDYARDTKRIAEASIKQLESSHRQLQISSDQLESSQTPFVVLTKVGLKQITIAYKLENQGSGPAMNVQGWIEWHGGAKKMEFHRQCLGQGGSISFDAADNQRLARFEYQSLSGREYVSEIDATGATKFIRVPPRGA